MKAGKISSVSLLGTCYDSCRSAGTGKGVCMSSTGVLGSARRG